MRRKGIRLIASFTVGLVLGLAIASALELFGMGGFFQTMGLFFLALAIVQLILFFKAF